ncbi:tape measure protein [Clostridium perfringens]|uniref:tape measure protein n=1 Tax=Clostridium perfringens TaxID=1502 RepID=UPI000DF10A13|nr:tape measure protein [Clostridium perfringens]STB59777.1 phage protein [Clostridium perfringens]
MITISDGTIIIDTKLDNSGAEKGLRNIKSEAAKLAHEYKKAGMSSSDAWKKAWSEIERGSSKGTNKVKADMSSIASIARKTATILAGVFIIDKIKDYTREIYKAGISYDALSEQALVAWTTILGSHAEAVKMMEKITDYAAETPFSKMGVDTMAKQLANADFKGQALFDQLTKFGDMGSAFGIQEDSLKEMVRQYAQVQQAQVAYTEDLNILQDRGIPIFKALGEVMGVPVSQVKKLASEGKITAEVYNKAINSIAENTKGAMEGQSKTFNGMMSTLEDNLSILWGYLAQDWFEGIKSSLSSFLPKFEEFVKLVGTDGLSGAVSKTIPELSPLVEMLSNLGNIMHTVVIPALFKFGLWCSQHINIIAALVITLGTLNLVIKGVLATERIILFIQSFKKAIIAIKEFEILTKLATAAQWLFNAALSANPIGLVIIGLVALIAGLVYLWNTSEGFRNFWINAWESIKNTCSIAIDGISKFFTDTIPSAFDSLINSAKATKDFFVNGFEYLKNAVSNFGTLLVTRFKNWCDEVWILFTQTIPSWIQSIVDWFSELPYHIGYPLSYVFIKLVMFGVQVIDFFANTVPTWIDAIINWFSELPGKIWTWLVDSLNKVKAWGLEMGAKATQIASEFLVNTGTWLSQLPGRIWTYLTDSFNKVKQWGFDMGVKAGQIAAEFLNNTIDYFSKLPGRIWEWLVNTVSKVKAWGVDLWNAGVDSAKQLVDSVVNTVEAIPGKMLDIGRHIVEGLWQGIINAKNWFMRQVNGFFSGIVDGAKAALGIHSPARKMIPVGDYTVQGMEVGIEKRMPSLQSNMKEKLLNLTREMKAKVAYESQSLGATVVSRSSNEIINKNSNDSENNPRKFILNIENKNYLDGEELAGHTTQKVIENIGESQDSYTISTGGEFSFA